MLLNPTVLHLYCHFPTQQKPIVSHCVIFSLHNRIIQRNTVLSYNITLCCHLSIQQNPTAPCFHFSTQQNPTVSCHAANSLHNRILLCHAMLSFLYTTESYSVTSSCYCATQQNLMVLHCHVTSTQNKIQQCLVSLLFRRSTKQNSITLCCISLNNKTIQHHVMLLFL